MEHIKIFENKWYQDKFYFYKMKEDKESYRLWGDT
jgi:hypothetical protein